MKIGIIGSGDVARSLAIGLARKGHSTFLGTSDPARLQAQLGGGAAVAVGTMAQAADFGDLVILAVKGSAAVSVARSVAAELNAKTVIDANNPIADAPPEQGVLRWFTGPNESLMEALQAAVPGAHFVKALNSVGHAHMIDPQFEGGPPTMFIAGNDAGAKSQVAALMQQIGWEPADMGGAVAARAIEPLCMLWCIPGLLRNDWAHAFRLLPPKRT